MNEADQEQLQQYRNRLRINKHRLDDELEVQAELQERLSEKVALLSARMLEAKDDLTKTVARLTEDFREEVKSTKDTVEAKVVRHPERVRAWQRLQEATGDHAKWDGLLDAWKARGKDLHALGRLFGDQYFSLTTHSISESHLRNTDRVTWARPSREGRTEYAAATPSRQRAALD